MISSAKLIEQLGNTSFKKLPLPFSQRFTQHDCFEAKKREMDTHIKNMDSVNKSSLGQIVNTDTGMHALNTMYKDMLVTNAGDILPSEKVITATIDFDTYLNYTENELLPLPEVLRRIVKRDTTKDLEKARIYGFKNPESFYKSIILVQTPDFMTQNKYARNQTIIKFKRELAFGANEIFRTASYIQLKDPVFKLDQIVRNLIDKESYTDNGIFQLTADFLNKSLVIFDIVGKKYSVFWPKPVVDVAATADGSTSGLGDAYFLINYNGCFSPCIYVDTHNIFNGRDLVDELSSQYEFENAQLYAKHDKNMERPIPKPERSMNAVPYLDPLFSKITEREQQMKARVVTEAPIAPPAPAATENKSASSSTNDNTKSLGPIKNYTLEQLQTLATDLGIEVTRPNAKDKPVRKTKQQLYDDILAASNPPSGEAVPATATAPAEVTDAS
jgi:hypothetical protein